MKNAKLGTSFNDRQLAGEVRSLALSHLKKVLDEDYEDKDYQKQMLLKLANTLLPRLNELTGADGEPLILPSELITKNDTAPNTKNSSDQQEQI